MYSIWRITAFPLGMVLEPEKVESEGITIAPSKKNIRSMGYNSFDVLQIRATQPSDGHREANAGPGKWKNRPPQTVSPNFPLARIAFAPGLIQLLFQCRQAAMGATAQQQRRHFYDCHDPHRIESPHSRSLSSPKSRRTEKCLDALWRRMAPCRWQRLQYPDCYRPP